MTTTAQPPMPDNSTIERFREVVYTHYEHHGRDFPWRHTTNPYHITVAEVMLQQTQTGRVTPRYVEFTGRFPDFEALARARPADVLDTWQGLGYNRRALALHAIAQRVCTDFGGCLPQEKEFLRSLPGIGPYTAAAIRAFAFDLPDVVIETNIRAAFIHDFFPERSGVSDAEILPLVEATMDRAHPRRWYQALMDYGAMLKESGNPSRRSAQHRTQSRFVGSRRQARGIIVRTLLRDGPMSARMLASAIAEWDSRFDDAFQTLKRDGLVVDRGTVISIAP